MSRLPPLLSERPPATRNLLFYGAPLAAGLLAGAMLGLALWAWVVASVLATIGGIGAGLEHDAYAGAARRGVTGGVLFGLGVVIADALVVDDRVARLADPAILQLVVTGIAGTLLGLLGCWLRGRLGGRTPIGPPVTE